MGIDIRRGDCRQIMREMIAEGVQIDCCITSPPYWGLRSYLDADDPNKKFEIGSEPTLGEHIEVMLDVFRLVRQLLTPTGSLWINYGDCYATTPNGRSAAATKAVGTDDRTFRDKPFSTIGDIHPPTSADPFRRDMGRRGGGRNSDARLKPKDLCMIPNRLAIALQEDGWWVRSEIIWGKNNPMPDSSGKYRPSTAHEKIFLLSKNGKMFYNHAAVALPCSESTHLRISQDLANQIGSDRAHGGAKKNGPMKAVVNKNLGHSKPRSFHKDRENGEEFRAKKQDGHGRRHEGFNERYAAQRPKVSAPGTGIKANSSFEESVCLKQETRYLRNYEPPPFQVWEMATQSFKEAHFATFPTVLPERCIKAGCPEGGTVFDPFGGAGTTGLVADRLQRHAILIELKSDYANMTEKRIVGDSPLFVELKGK